MIYIILLLIIIYLITNDICIERFTAGAETKVHPIVRTFKTYLHHKNSGKLFACKHADEHIAKLKKNGIHSLCDDYETFHGVHECAHEQLQNKPLHGPLGDADIHDLDKHPVKATLNWHGNVHDQKNKQHTSVPHDPGAVLEDAENQINNKETIRILHDCHDQSHKHMSGNLAE